MVRSLARLAMTFAFLGASLPVSARAQDTERITVDSKENEGDRSSRCGRRPATTGGEKALVVFASDATNLVSNDLNGVSDIFLRDLGAGTTTRIVFDFSGKELWAGDLPFGGQATPMTYAIGGRQYVVVAAGGHATLGNKIGDALVAFALPP